MLNRRIVFLATVLGLLPAVAQANSSGGKLPVISLATASPGITFPEPPAAEDNNTDAVLNGWPEPKSEVPAAALKPQNPSKQTKRVQASQQGKNLRAEGDSQPKVQPGMVMEPPISVMPEATTTVRLSSSDLNRIVCPDGEIKEALTSDEKGLMIKITGKDAFVKFKVAKHGDGGLSYSTTPTEIYLVCGGNTYSMIAFPSRMPSQTIKLSSGTGEKIKENQSLYAGLPFEKKIMRAIKDVYTDSMPDSYTVTRMNKTNSSWNRILINLKKEVDIEGEGMHIKEFQVSLKSGENEPFKMSEKMFLKKDFANNPVAVSIDKHTLRPGDVSRVFIVEQRAEKTLTGSGLMLPSLEGGLSTSQVSAAPAQQAQKPPLLSASPSKPGLSQYSSKGGLQ